MSFHDSTPSHDAERRGRLRHARASRHTDKTGDGILVLVTSDSPRDRSANSSKPMFDDTALAQLRAEHDAALEQVTFLEEQLRSTVAFHRHLFERERTRVLAEQQVLLRDLEILGDELERRRGEEMAAAAERSDRDDPTVVAGSTSAR